MIKKLVTRLAATALTAAGLLIAPAAAHAETIGPCGLHYDDSDALYTNCSIYAKVVTVDKWFSSDYTICITGKAYNRYLGTQYGDNHVQGVKDVRTLPGTYCDWMGG
jgi:hypothetical protein